MNVPVETDEYNKCICMCCTYTINVSIKVFFSLIISGIKKQTVLKKQLLT